MKLGLIGPGRHGIRYAETCDDVEAMLSRSGTHYKSEKVSRRPRFGDAPRMYTDMDAFFGECLDGVIIATSPQSHRELCFAAIDRGIPVLVEKPLALTSDDCRAIVDHAERSSVPLLVAHLHLFDPEFESTFLNMAAPMPDVLNTIAGGPSDHSDRGTFGDSAYSVMQDWGPHDVAMAIAANHYRMPDEWHVSEVGEQAWIQMRWDGRRASCVVGRLPHKVRTFSSSDGRQFPKPIDGANRNTIERIMAVLRGLIRGEVDPRSAYSFTRSVYRVLYEPMPQADPNWQNAAALMAQAATEDMRRIMPQNTEN